MSTHTASPAQPGDTFVTPRGDRLPVVKATDEKVAIGDPSAYGYRYAASVKWYKRTSPILARWTLEVGR